MKTDERRLRSAREWRERNPDANRRISREGHRAKTARDPAWYLHRLAKQSARTRGKLFTIEVELIRELLEPMTCAATGLPLRWDPETAKDEWAPSIDRIDGSLGYVPGNVRIVAWVYNRMRGELSDAEFVERLRMLLERLV